MVSEIYKAGELHNITVKNYPSLLNLKKKDEELTDFVKQSPEAFLLRWFSFHLANATAKEANPMTISNFTDDIKVRKYLEINVSSVAHTLCGLQRKH
jgi:hypothetical protein